MMAKFICAIGHGQSDTKEPIQLPATWRGKDFGRKPPPRFKIQVEFDEPELLLEHLRLYHNLVTV